MGDEALGVRREVALEGRDTGESTPLIRAAAMILFLPGEWRASSATKRQRRPVTNFQPAGASI